MFGVENKSWLWMLFISVGLSHICYSGNTVLVENLYFARCYIREVIKNAMCVRSLGRKYNFGAHRQQNADTQPGRQ